MINKEELLDIICTESIEYNDLEKGELELIQYDLVLIEGEDGIFYWEDNNCENSPAVENALKNFNKFCKKKEK